MAVGQKWTNNGQAFAVDQLDENTIDATPTYHGHWGSGNTTPAVTDNALVSPNAEARVPIGTGGQSQVTTQSTGDTMQWVFTITASGTRVVEEVGIFSALTSGNCYIRIVHGQLNLESGDQVTYTIKLQLKDTSE